MTDHPYTIRLSASASTLADLRDTLAQIQCDIQNGYLANDVLNLKQLEVAKKLDIHPGQFNEIITCKRPIGLKVAFKLEKALLHSADYWLMLQLKYDIQEYRKINQ